MNVPILGPILKIKAKECEAEYEDMDSEDPHLVVIVKHKEPFIPFEHFWNSRKKQISIFL